ncbi:ARPP-1 family domain-containing protein [Acidobacteriota bacterium]
MDPIVIKYLSSFKFGELQHYQNMGVIPLLTSLDSSPEYLTLKEALEKKKLKITEVSQQGAVPELKVINEAEISVLLLDGEEVVGAKQNRVLNTTILLKEKSETIIPVSCTEQGRWAYSSKEFSDSDTVMSTRLRSIKAKTVSDTLADSQEYHSDQGTVWNAIEELSEEAEALSETGAMKAVFDVKKKDLDAYLKAFASIPGQKGVLAFVDGKVVGCDYISLQSAYNLLHSKLIKSYAVDALLQKGPHTGQPDVKMAEEFFADVVECQEKKYESIGKGWDYRFEGKALVGSALKFGNKVIHMAFFAVSESDKTGEMAGYRRRTRFRS